MKIRSFVLSVLTILLSSASLMAADAPPDERPLQQIAAFKEAAAKSDKAALVAMVRYPLKRPYPIPSIKNKTECLQRFDVLFDQSFLNQIATSDSDSDADWQRVGWRGTMWKRGLLWMSDDGLIRSINYSSPAEQAMRKQIIEKQRLALHANLQKFKAPVLEWQTKQFHIRIDSMDDNTYRYASWALPRKIGAQPDLIIHKGRVEYEGSGGNHSYYFRNNSYTYCCSVQVIGKDDIPGNLIVFENDKKILDQVVEKSLPE